ncbi:Spherulation-specific family 4-domain-containing protein [Podospora appendiculata]|uniref:Spherulation-specific family 4-domain-containing protein n=1 Tax=Podospora appendiculata TaxID=314037 RepID=A0AAE0X5J8_9PEZI|nr:Spherulation-specific family 4-domain-containing protein [Podospora appendiculata]
MAMAVLAHTQVLLPLYAYPGGAQMSPEWQAAVNAISNNSVLHFFVVINPNNGPQTSSDTANSGQCTAPSDPNYVEHGCNLDWTTNVDKINALPNAQTIGYVRTGYGTRSASDVKADITKWAAWNTANTWVAGRTANIKIHGIWFDETGTSKGNLTHYKDIITFANASFQAKGTQPSADLFSMATAVVLRETCWTDVSTGAQGDCPEPYTAFNYKTLSSGSGLPYDASLISKSAVIVHRFHRPPTANNETLQEQLLGIAGLGLHSTYFTSGNRKTTIATPATIGAFSEFLTKATQ